MTYHKIYSRYQTGAARVPEGYRRFYVFPNGFAVSVIRHDRGRWEGAIETGLLKVEGEGFVPIATLAADSTTMAVHYFESGAEVAEQMRLLLESDGPSGVDVLWASEIVE